MLVKVWSGLVQFLTDTALQAHEAKFKFLCVVATDRLVLVESEGDAPNSAANYPAVECIRAVEDDTLEVRLEGSVDELLGKLVELQIWRDVNKPCGICARAGLPAESDHKHCDYTRERLPLTYPFAYSAKVRDHAIQTLLTTGKFVAKIPVLAGKRTVTVHSTTFSENDAKREWEQGFLTDAGKDRSVGYYSEQEARIHMAFVLDDDGSGNSPFKALTPEHQQLPSVQRAKLMMDFFKNYSDTYYRVLLEQVRRVDGLIEEVCAEDIHDHYTDEQVLQLTEDMLNNLSFVTTVNIFGGKGQVLFTNATLDTIGKANEWAENAINDIRKDSNGVILKLRELDIQTVAKLAAEFRGDQRTTFDDNSSFDERLLYLMDLPLPLFYMYVRAGNVWRLRALRAGEVDAVGNF